MQRWETDAPHLSQAKGNYDFQTLATPMKKKLVLTDDQIRTGSLKFIRDMEKALAQAKALTKQGNFEKANDFLNEVYSKSTMIGDLVFANRFRMTRNTRYSIEQAG